MTEKFTYKKITNIKKKSVCTHNNWWDIKQKDEKKTFIERDSVWFITWLRDRSFFFSWWGSSHSDYLHNFFCYNVNLKIVTNWKFLHLKINFVNYILAACKKKVRKELNLIHFLLFFWKDAIWDFYHMEK